MRNKTYDPKRYRRPWKRRAGPTVTASVTAELAFPFCKLSMAALELGMPAPLSIPQPQTGVARLELPDKLIADGVRAVVELVARYPKQAGIAAVVSGLFLLYPRETSIALAAFGLLYLLGNTGQQVPGYGL
jgi:hypothetical protein